MRFRSVAALFACVSSSLLSIEGSAAAQPTAPASTAPAPAAPAPAPAAPAAAAPAAPAPARLNYHMETRWYGWQTLLADGASVALFVGGAVSDIDSLQGIAYGTFLVAPPVVHFSHLAVGKGFGDFAIRLIVPPVATLVGTIVGAIATAGTDSEDPTGFFSFLGGAYKGAEVGLVVGCVAVSAIDAFALANEKIQVQDDAEGTSEAKRRSRPWFQLAPTFSASQNGGRLGLAGTF